MRSHATFIVECPYVFQVYPFLAQKQGGIPLFGEAPLFNTAIGRTFFVDPQAMIDLRNRSADADGSTNSGAVARTIARTTLIQTKSP